MDLDTLRRKVENDAKNYQYDPGGEAAGTAWPKDRVEAKLGAMCAALVEPYWADVELHDTHEQIAAAPAIVRRCAIVAVDPNGPILAFDPVENEFLLAVNLGDALVSIGARGDAVGCFVAR